MSDFDFITYKAGDFTYFFWVGNEFANPSRVLGPHVSTPKKASPMRLLQWECDKLESEICALERQGLDAHIKRDSLRNAQKKLLAARTARRRRDRRRRPRHAHDD